MSKSHFGDGDNTCLPRYPCLGLAVCVACLFLQIVAHVAGLPKVHAIITDKER